MSAETASAVRGIGPGREPLPQPVLVGPGKRLQALLRRREPWGHAKAALTSLHCNRSSRLEYNPPMITINTT